MNGRKEGIWDKIKGTALFGVRKSEESKAIGSGSKITL